MRIRPVLSVLTLALGMAQTPAFALDLAEAYAKARQNDPNWSAARNNYEAEQQTVNIGRGGLLPTLAISGSLSENSFKPDMAVPPATTTSDVDFQSTQYGAKLTQPLFRADAARQRATGGSHGSGLGLSICRAIVQAHGGTIRAEASALGGLAVVARLPLNADPHGDADGDPA